MAQILIDTAGTVTPLVGNATWVHLEDVEFDTGTVSSLVFGSSSFVAQAKWYTD